MRLSLGLVSLLVSVAFSAPPSLVPRYEHTARAPDPETPKLHLIPVSTGNRVNTVGRHVAPSKNLNLAWQTPDNASLVAVALSMQHPAVVLEDVDDVTAVDCTGQASVAVTFRDLDAFNEALTAWSGLNDSFVLVTNHMGDCDTELERSFFVADTDTLASHESNFTIVAKAEKKDVYSTAHETDITFNSLTVPNSDVDKRDITLDKEGLTIDYNYTLPKAQTVYIGTSTTIILREASIINSVTYAGHIKWKLLDGVTDFTIDVSKSMSHHANVTFDVAAKLTGNWSWAPEPLTYALIDVPGILHLGPSAGVSFGGSVTAQAGGSVTANLTSSMPNGTIHLDFINWDQSTSAGWTTNQDANFDVSESAKLTLKPFVAFTVDFACNLFSGLIDLSTGIKAEPSFPFITAATATQSINSTGGVSIPESACANGLSEEVDFKFQITAFATELLSVVLYDYTVPLFKKCISV